MNAHEAMSIQSDIKNNNSSIRVIKYLNELLGGLCNFYPWTYYQLALRDPERYHLSLKFGVISKLSLALSRVWVGPVNA